MRNKKPLDWKDYAILVGIIIFLGLLVWSQTAFAKSFTGRVIDVYDGDTVRVVQPDPKGGCSWIHKIRLRGVDSPERSQSYGKAARQFVRNLLFGRKIFIKASPTKRDRWGRIIADICWSGGKNPYKCLSYQLIRAGLAWHYKAYDKDKRLSRAEMSARKAKRGLWSQAKPEAPWLYRRRRKSTKGHGR